MKCRLPAAQGQSPVQASVQLLVQSGRNSTAVAVNMLRIQCSIVASTAIGFLSMLICESRNPSLMPRCCWCVLPVRLVFLSISPAQAERNHKGPGTPLPLCAVFLCCLPRPHPLLASMPHSCGKLVHRVDSLTQDSGGARVARKIKRRPSGNGQRDGPHCAVYDCDGSECPSLGGVTSASHRFIRVGWGILRIVTTGWGRAVTIRLAQTRCRNCAHNFAAVTVTEWAATIQ
jgi:hypothetical protein